MSYMKRWLESHCCVCEVEIPSEPTEDENMHQRVCSDECHEKYVAQLDEEPASFDVPSNGGAW